jgi:hypothetical protein
VISRLDPRYPGPYLLDDSRSLVTADDRQPRGDVSGHHVQIRVAQPGVREADQDLALAWTVQVEFLDLDRLPSVDDHGGLCLH